MSAATAINGGEVPSIIQTEGNVSGRNSPNPTENKTEEATREVFESLNKTPSEPSLSGRVAHSTIGRTWPQFGQLVASYVTLGLVSAPTLRAPVSSVETQDAAFSNVGEAPSGVSQDSSFSNVEGAPSAELPTANKEGATKGLETPPAPTFIARALDAIKSFFTGILNFLFGARNS
jgi:hypothetical protein